MKVGEILVIGHFPIRHTSHLSPDPAKPRIRSNQKAYNLKPPLIDEKYGLGAASKTK